MDGKYFTQEKFRNYVGKKALYILASDFFEKDDKYIFKAKICVV